VKGKRRGPYNRERGKKARVALQSGANDKKRSGREIHHPLFWPKKGKGSDGSGLERKISRKKREKPVKGGRRCRRNTYNYSRRRKRKAIQDFLIPNGGRAMKKANCDPFFLTTREKGGEKKGKDLILSHWREKKEKGFRKKQHGVPY